MYRYETHMASLEWALFFQVQKKETQLKLAIRVLSLSLTQ